MADADPSYLNALFADIFRRADKNDDDSLSLAEFKGFFADGVLTEGELESLFARMDTSGNGQIETAELAAYFTQNMGDTFKDLFRAHESLAAATHKCLLESHQQTTGDVPASPSRRMSFSEQGSGAFIPRFLFKESGVFLVSLLQQLELAHTMLTQQAANQRPADSTPLSVDDTTDDALSSLQRRRQRRSGKVGASSSSAGLDEQVDRLAAIVDRLTRSVSLHPVDQVAADDGDATTVVLSCRQMVLVASEGKAFNEVLGAYITATRQNDDCISINVRLYDNECAVYEVWQSQDALEAHFVSAPARTFLRSAVEFQAKPERFTQMPIPAAWLDN